MPVPMPVPMRRASRLLPLLAAALVTSGCASSFGGSASADLPAALPCEPQPWDVTGAPSTADEFRTAGALPPIVLNAGKISRMVLEGTNDIRTQVPGSLRAQAVFQILVGPDGVSLEYDMTSSSGNERVNALGAELARSIEFRPATRFGCGVVAWFEFPVRINL